jgi:hypothetical protein
MNKRKAKAPRMGAGQPNASDCTMYRWAIDAQIGAEAVPALE